MGIEIPKDVADEAGVPDDLDAGPGGTYEFPSPRRRRVAGAVYLAAASACFGGAAVGLAGGLWAAGALFVVLAAYHMSTAWKVVCDEREALVISGRSVGFPVGHASAALGFEGWLSKPVWSVLMYSADDPPSRRALARVDGRTGALVAEPYVEQIPAV